MYEYVARSRDSARSPRPTWRSRRLLPLGLERAGLHGPIKSPSFRVRTAIGPPHFEWSPALNLTPENATDAPATSIAPDAPLLECYAVALEFAAMRLVSLPGSRGRDYATKMQRVA